MEELVDLRRAIEQQRYGDAITLAIEEAFPSALIQATLEAFEGQYLPEQLATKINKSAIEQKALKLISGEQI